MNKLEFTGLMASTGMQGREVREDTLLFTTAEDVMLVFTDAFEVIYVTGWKKGKCFTRSYHSWGAAWEYLPVILENAHEIAE